MPDIRVVPFLVSELRLPLDEQELLQREWWPSYAHAVVHRDGVFLFDNGAGFGNEEVESTFTPRVTASAPPVPATRKTAVLPLMTASETVVERKNDCFCSKAAMYSWRYCVWNAVSATAGSPCNCCE